MKKPVTVLVIGMAPIVGGIETLLISLFRSIDKTKIHFDFLTFCDKCAFEEEIVQAGSTVYHATRRGEDPIQNKKDLENFFQNHPDDYDYVWYHLSSASNCLPVVLAKKYTNAVTVCHSHGTSFESKSLFRPIHLLLGKLNRPKFFKATDVCFGCSKAAWEWLFKGSNKPMYLIHNGIDLDKFKFSQVIRDKIRSDLSIPSDSFVIGHAGRFCDVKNQPFMLDLFKAFHDKHENSIMLFAGEGETLDFMKQKAKDLDIDSAVRFLGFRNDLNDLLQAFDLFMLPSLSEGLPLTAIEAQTAGLPCLLSSGVPEETAITDLVKFSSLDAPLSNWVDSMESLLTMKIDRGSYAQKVKDAGYDYKDTAEYITNFFVNGLMEEKNEH